MRLARVATCNLNQWALDFAGNVQRIQQSIQQAKQQGARYRVGPELEIPGYGCEDHFFELDTVEHSWECIAELLAGEDTHGILCDVGMPVEYHGVLYNCRVFLLNGEVLFIRPKLAMANDGNYRETRYFASWKRGQALSTYALPSGVKGPQGANTCPFGDAVLQLQDASLAAETCEELFTPSSPHINLALNGVEIISNGSGSHHQLRKLDQRLDLIRGATAKGGGVYLYANQRGCDGGRLYYDGCACVAVNGQLVAQGQQFGLSDVEVVVATADLDAVVSYRQAIGSFREQASNADPHTFISVPFSLTVRGDESHTLPWQLTMSTPITPRVHRPEEEIAFGPACWMWDYLRRSGASGYMLPLSGGADSSATAAIVGAMCQLVVRYIHLGDENVRREALRVGQYKEGEEVRDATDLAGRIFATAYMGTVNSSGDTRARAAQLAKEIGAYHLSFDVDTVVEAVVALFQAVTGKRPLFRVDGGSSAENLALQNIQARLRMVLTFLFAQLVPWVRGRPGFLLVLGSANVDELLRGYLTKYDCSSADINPIGGISKTDLKRFLSWASDSLGYPSLAAVVTATPTAELEPLREGQKPQNDEDDMGVTYAQLSVFGKLRKVACAGPVSAFRHCLQLWREQYSVTEIAEKVKFFFRYYAINRHKATVITPSYHAESYSPDDNRFDHRQFLYNVAWPWQFKKIDQLAQQAEQAQKRVVAADGSTGGGPGAGAVTDHGHVTGGGGGDGGDDTSRALPGVGPAVMAMFTPAAPPRPPHQADYNPSLPK